MTACINKDTSCGKYQLNSMIQEASGSRREKKQN